uniref:ACT domain-containing protein n=1 Tax=Chloropicon laureae TaxID=464258 RepID=A0A7S2Z3V9_9CHLO|mmetsp:Transcript_4441/g.11199  ORF Transcript_4441/g.11199 Transcript_4441/m.11199 type:complete len:291 (+) Transcript_4441:255-1127(+)
MSCTMLIGGATTVRGARQATLAVAGSRRSHAAGATNKRGGCSAFRAERALSQRPSLPALRAMVADNNVAGENQTDAPQPIVKINNESDPLATVVSIKFGDYLGDLLDTVGALKNLDLNIVRAKFDVDGNKNKFFITDAKNGEKIFSTRRLEEIRMTIINNLILYHPESVEELSSFFHAKRAAEPLSALGARGAPSVSTDITLHRDANDIRSILEITTADRPGLLVDIVRTLKDISVNVVSAKAETIGRAAHDVFAVTYHGEPLNAPMETLVVNALYYYLARAEVEKEESY